MGKAQLWTTAWTWRDPARNWRILIVGGGSALSIVVMIISVFMIFFSSRRRHTRLERDWSSDVCSSDLGVASGVLIGLEIVAAVVPIVHHAVRRERSEERRVGKGWRSRWRPHP